MLSTRSFLKSCAQTAAGLLVPAYLMENQAFAGIRRRVGIGMKKQFISNTIIGPDGLTYGIITALDGHQWLDRNLGATQVATSKTDATAYGWRYQWGRYCDGHQVTSSATTSTLSDTDTPGHGNYILTSEDWRSTANNNLWQGLSGINNPCPANFRLPTSEELLAVFTAEGIGNADQAFNSTLKFTVGGSRRRNTGEYEYYALRGYYWTSTVSSNRSSCVYFTETTLSTLPDYYRGSGMCIRCIKNY